MNKLIEIIIVMLLIQSCGAYAADQCDIALDDCIAVNTEQANYINILKKQVMDLEDKVANTEPPHPVAWFLAGMVAAGFGILLINRGTK